MSTYEQHRHQMIETRIKEYLPSPQGSYDQENMMENLRIMSEHPESPDREPSQIPDVR